MICEIYSYLNPSRTRKSTFFSITDPSNPTVIDTMFLQFVDNNSWKTDKIIWIFGN